MLYNEVIFNCNKNIILLSFFMFFFISFTFISCRSWRLLFSRSFFNFFIDFFVDFFFFFTENKYLVDFLEIILVKQKRTDVSCWLTAAFYATAESIS